MRIWTPTHAYAICFNTRVLALEIFTTDGKKQKLI